MAVLAGALALCLGTPALASAAQSFAVTSPTGFPAGGHPSYTTTQNLDSAAMGSPGKVTITLAPGVLASLAANPSCIKGTAQYTDACKIGTGSASTSLGVGLGLTAYLVPPPGPGNAAGIDLLTPAYPMVAPSHVAVSLVQTPTGNVASVLNLDLSSLGPLAGMLTTMSLTVNGTLGGKPFTRMPTNCSPGHSTMTVQYANGSETTQASPDFAPTGCASLPFAPQVTATAVKDAHDNGTQVVTSQTQAVGEAAGLSTTLILPWPALSPNQSSLGLQNSGVPVGSAVATSPLQPTPLTGLAYLTGAGPFTPTLTLKFPPPVALTLIGAVSLTNHSVTFSGLPDVPQTALVVTLFGGPKAAQAASCAPPGGILHAGFTGQNGASTTATFPLTVAGCPTVPKLSAVALTGLANRQPGLSFRLARGTAAPNLKSVTVSLPAGLTFKTTKRRVKGVVTSVPSTLALSGGQLTITLKRPAATLAVRIGSAALLESKQLQRQVKLHKANPTGQLRFDVADAGGSSSTLTPTG